MFNHILVPVAPSHIGENRQAMTVAKNLMANNGKISVLSVLEEIPPYVEPHLPADYRDKNIAKIKSELLVEFQAENPSIIVIPGHSSRSILDWVGQNDVDCIVMSSHLPGFTDLFLGSTASKVVRHAKCSVIVLR